MKAVKVNAKEKTVKVIELNGGEDNAGTLEDWYREVECSCVVHFYIYHLGFNYDLMFIMDDEGLFKEEKYFWQMTECHSITGNALVFGVDRETGEMIDFVESEVLKKNITFLS